MIERKFISRNLKTHLINEYLAANLKRVGYSGAKVQRTPLGEKVIITASRPGLIVGKKGSNIKKLTAALKHKFGLENPQIEINEVADINLDPQIVAERIVNYLERFGAGRFKSIGHKVIGDVINSGALGIEVIISGKIPGARAKSWRFYQGYLKKCGDMAVSGIKKATASANLKSGTVGIKISIMPAELKEKYDIKLREIKEEVVAEDVEGSKPSTKDKCSSTEVKDSKVKKTVEEKIKEKSNKKEDFKPSEKQADEKKDPKPTKEKSKKETKTNKIEKKEKVEDKE